MRRKIDSQSATNETSKYRISLKFLHFCHLKRYRHHIKARVACDPDENVRLYYVRETAVGQLDHTDHTPETSKLIELDPRTEM